MNLRRQVSRWLVLLSWLQTAAFAADLVFSGSLRSVGNDSIAIKLADRRVITARFPIDNQKTAARYEIGDQLKITCRSIQPVWDANASRYYFLEITNVELLGHSAPPVPPAIPALGERTASPDSPSRYAFEHAREVNLDYSAKMPNFVADETGKRYTGEGKSPKWRLFDTIETEITIKGSESSRDHIRRDGRAWNQPYRGLPGFKWSGGFGTEIKPVFDVKCPTTIEFQGRAEVRGKRLMKYRFSSPADGCFVRFYDEYQEYNPARSGHVYIDESSSNVIQLDEDAEGFPAGFPFAHRHEEVSWDYVKIGDESHLLPVAALFEVTYSSGKPWKVEVQYKNHRHFQAASSVTFH